MLRNAFVFYQVMVWIYCTERFINMKKFEKWHPSKHFLFSKTSSRRLEDVFSVTLFVFQDVFKTCLQDVLQLCLQDVFKTSWKTKKCYTEDVFKTSSRRLQYVFIKTNVCWDSFSRCQVLEQKHWELSLEIKGNKCNSVFHTAVKALIKLAIAAIKEVISTTIFFLSISSNCKI